MIGIIDYGAGNLRSLRNALVWLDTESIVVDHPIQLNSVSSIIVPGVGAYRSAMSKLTTAGFVTPLQDWSNAGKPLFGICLGMQLLARTSEEGGLTDGLGLVEARIIRMRSAPGVRVPHVGWNTVSKIRDAAIWGDMETATCYHAHSYRYEFDDPTNEKNWVAGIVEHGESVVSIIERDNVMGAQFHPEKSQRDGLGILKNFLKLATC